MKTIEIKTVQCILIKVGINFAEEGVMDPVDFGGVMSKR